MVSTRGELNHTHSPRPMEAMLADLAATGAEPPDLVVADHGWAGAAGQAGITSVGFADSNDPALFVGEHEGKVARRRTARRQRGAAPLRAPDRLPAARRRDWTESPWTNPNG